MDDFDREPGVFEDDLLRYGVEVQDRFHLPDWIMFTLYLASVLMLFFLVGTIIIGVGVLFWLGARAVFG